METIQKSINYEFLINRIGGNTPSVEAKLGRVPYGNDFNAYGTISCDVVVDDGDLYEGYRIPIYTLVESDEQVAVMPFSVLSDNYMFLKNFILGCEFYKMCMQGDGYVWRKLPFKGEPEEDELFIDVAIEQFYEYFNNGATLVSELPEFDSQYVGNIYCVNENTDEFITRFGADSDVDVDEVENSSKFFDFAHWVLFENGKSLSKFRIPGINISVLLDTDILDNGMFQAVDEEEGLRAVGSVSDFQLGVDDDEYVQNSGVVGYVTESVLRTMKRSKNAVDDKGNEKPYCVDISSLDPNDSGTVKAELPYSFGGSLTSSTTTLEDKMKGAVNVRTENGKVFFDYVESYTLYYGEIEEFECYFEDGEFMVSGATEVADEGDGNIIRIDYYVNCFVCEDDTIVPGVKMIDFYTYETKEDKFSMFFDSRGWEEFDIEYIDINYEEPLLGEGKAFAIHDCGTETFNSPAWLIKDAWLDGVHDLYFTENNVKVERGRSACFEALSILGESNSVEDLERYRGDYFRIKGKND